MLIPVDDLWPDDDDPLKPRLICEKHDWFTSDEEQEPCAKCRVAELEAARDAAIANKNAAWAGSQLVKQENDRLRAAIREIRDEVESSGPGCRCWQGEIHTPCWKCRLVARLRALTEGE